MVRTAKQWTFWLVLSVYLLFGYAMPVMVSACLQEVHFSMRPAGEFCHKSRVVLRLSGSHSCEACPKTCTTKLSTIQLASLPQVKRHHCQTACFLSTALDYAPASTVKGTFVPGQVELPNATLTHLRTVILLI